MHERWDHQLASRLDHGLHEAVGLPGRLRTARFRLRNSHPLQFPACLENVDRAPISKIVNRQLDHALDGCLRVHRGAENVAGLAQEIEPTLPDSLQIGRSTLRGAHLFSLVVRSLALTDVDQKRLDVERLSHDIPDRRGLLTDPDDSPIASNEPVLATEPAAVSVRTLVCIEHFLAVVGMQKPGEELWFCTPLCRRVTKHRLHLRADVDARAPVTGSRPPRQKGEILSDGSVLRLRLPQLLA